MANHGVEQGVKELEPHEALEVRTFGAGDESGVLDLLQAAFGKWPSDLEGVDPAEFFRWKMACPFGPPISIVAEAEGRVVGFSATMPWRLRAQGQILATMRGVDLAVHPSYRRRGVSLAIMRAAIEQVPEDVAFTWNNPNDQSRSGVLKTGRRKAVSLPRFVQLRPTVRRTARRAYGKGSRTPAHLPVEAESAAEVLRDGAHISRLLSKAEESSDRLTTAIDLDYLRWRYGHFEEYRAIQSDAGADPGGIAIFRLRRRGAFWVSDVCELLVAKDDFRIARHLLRQVRDASPVDFIRCGFSSRQHAVRCGFVQAGMTIVITRPVTQNLDPDPTQRDSWALSLGDLELL